MNKFDFSINAQEGASEISNTNGVGYVIPVSGGESGSSASEFSSSVST